MQIYLDNQATTPLHPVALEAMKPFMTEKFGNASSQHSWGWASKLAVEKARKQVADLVGCHPKQVLFTSGATESIHMAAVGWLLAQKEKSQCRLITSSIEHKATFGAFSLCEELGAEVIQVEVKEDGSINEAQLVELIEKDQRPCFVSLIHGHNELGTLNPVESLSARFNKMDHVCFHVDGAQSVGKIPVHFENNNYDLFSISAHKLYGPKGLGCLLLKEDSLIRPLFTGSGQERDLRSGTLNVPSIVGFGAVCEWFSENGPSHVEKLKSLRDGFLEELKKLEPKVSLNGSLTQRLPHNIHLTIDGVSKDDIADAFFGIAISRSSACSSGPGQMSHTLRAIGFSPERAQSSFRVGLGLNTTQEELNVVLEKIKSLI